MSYRRANDKHSEQTTTCTTDKHVFWYTTASFNSALKCAYFTMRTSTASFCPSVIRGDCVQSQMMLLLWVVDFSGKPLVLFVYSEQCWVTGPLLPNSWLILADSQGTYLWTGKLLVLHGFHTNYRTCFAFTFFCFCKTLQLNLSIETQFVHVSYFSFSLCSLFPSFDPVALQMKAKNNRVKSIIIACVQNVK